MITLSLLHPIKQIPVQVWTFENESTIRIGRSTDNQVILYSAVVSRHHVELRRVGNSWEVVNLGTNGTYLDGKRITQVSVTDGAVIRLARSGPNIQIRIGTEALKDLPKTTQEERTVSQQRPDYPTISTEINDQSSNGEDVIEPEASEGNQPLTRGTIPVPPHLQLPSDEVTVLNPVSGFSVSGFQPSADEMISTADPLSSLPTSLVCPHRHNGSLFCPDCGEPLQVLHTVKDYKILKVLGQGEIGITYLAWRDDRTVVLKTLNSQWSNNRQAMAALECEAEILQQINHPRIPHLIDFFSVADQSYMVMDLIPGQTLAQQITGKTLVSVDQAIAWILEICKILGYLHNFVPPLLHRGIKPSSLIPLSLGHPPNAIALVDFGAIKAVVLGEKTPIGSKAYSAPEHLEINATPSVDLYALGPLFAHLITGQNPIAFYTDRGEGYRFYADAIPGLNLGLAEVIHVLTNPRPDDRYASASDLIKALHKVKARV